MRLLSSLSQKISVILLAVLVAGCAELSESVTEPIKSPLTYVDDIQPIFERSCVRCHGGTHNSIIVKRGNYDLTSYQTAVTAPYIIPGNSSLSSVVFQTSAQGDMHQYLNSPEESEMIYNWVVLDSAAEK